MVNPQLQRELGIPLEFVTFAHIEGKMFHHFKKDNSFVLQDVSNPWGNKVVYGAIFHLRDSEFYLRLLDAYNGCSLSSLRRNHDLDIEHRVTTKATPITFASIDHLERLMYTERSPVDVQVYVGNVKHPKINQRLNKRNSYRIISGVDTNYKQLIREVLQDE